MNVSNAGPSPATNVFSAVTVPTGVSVTSTGGGTLVRGIVYWTDPKIAGGATVSHTVTFKVNQHTNRTVVIGVAAASLQVKDPNYANNVAAIVVALGNSANKTARDLTPSRPLGTPHQRIARLERAAHAGHRARPRTTVGGR